MRHLVLAPLLGLAVACSAPTIDEEEGEIESSGEALTRACSRARADLLGEASPARREILERGFSWLDANVAYHQGRFYRGYRTDCSGFISMCWDLDGSYTTSSFALGGGDSFRLASYDDLLPGDALVWRSGGRGHIVLFLGWNDNAHEDACVLEQSSTRLDMEFGVRSASSLRRTGYRAIRADKLADDH